MKGIKVSLDTKVNANLINWRKLSHYDASKDALYLKTTDLYDIPVSAPYNEGEGYYCISFEVKSDNANYFTTHYAFGDVNKQVVSYSKNGHISSDYGHVDYDLRKGVWERCFAVYKMSKGTDSILLRFRAGASYVRNVKLEYSDHPTDYVDYQGGGNP